MSGAVDARRGIPRLHVVTDDEVLASASFGNRARDVVRAGADRIALHLRGPSTRARDLWDLGSALAVLTRASGTPLLVNDRVDLALALRATGVHLGARGLETGAARALVGVDALLGRSVHGSDEVGDSGVDYLHAGTVFPTRSHPGRRPLGVGGLARVVERAADLPVLGIGGIGPERVADVLGAGAYGVAVVSAVWGAPDPGRAVEDLLAAVAASCTSPSAESASGTPPSGESASGGGRELRLRVNGAERRAPAGATVRDLLEGLGLIPALVVVERNREILARDRYAETTLADGDVLELVHFVGGGEGT